MKLPKACLPLLLLCALLLGACGTQREAESYSLTVWYAEGDPLAPFFAELAKSYDRSRGKNTLPVTLRAFEDEERLRTTLQSGSLPALVLCSHELAFSLQERELLVDLHLESPAYPDWLLSRSESVGRGFYPLGLELPLLCAKEGVPAGLDALLAKAARHGRETALPYLSLDAFAPLFYQTLLDRGTEFTADPDRESRNKDYVNLYNALAEAWFAHGLSVGETVDTPCRIESSTALPGRDLSGFTLRTLSDGELLGTARGLAVTARDSRMQRALPDFLRFLFQSGQAGRAALGAGLVPAVTEELSPAAPSDDFLLSLVGRPLHLPDGNSKYYVNQNAFETAIRAALELLH